MLHICIVCDKVEDSNDFYWVLDTDGHRATCCKEHAEIAKDNAITKAKYLLDMIENQKIVNASFRYDNVKSN